MTINRSKSTTYDVWDLPGSVTLHLTEVCNLRCKMCYEWGEKGAYSTATDGAKPRSINIDVLRELINTLEPRKPFYSLFGGEPLAYSHLDELIRLVKNSGGTIDTPTNGTMLERQAPMLVDLGFDSIRVSIDGPEEISDAQRGKGSWAKAMAGIEALYREREKPSAKGPLIGIIYTVTPENYRHIERFFLKDLDLRMVNWVTIQMQNFLTLKRGEFYAAYIKDEFGIASERYWRGLVQDPSSFAEMDIDELSRQVLNVSRTLWGMGKVVTTLPKLCSPENLKPYWAGDFASMTEQYVSCPIPHIGFDLTAGGDVAPCHIFYDLTFGNLYEKSLPEIWNDEKYRRFREHMKSRGLMSICHGCCLLYINGKQKF